MRALLTVMFSLAASLGMHAQAQLGSLLYADPVGRGIRLVVVDGGLPDRMTLRREEGDENRLRKMVLALAGPERFQASTIQALVNPVPVAWRVDQRSGGSQIRVGDVTYWRYLPGQVLPVRFLFDRKIWTLQSAELPSRKFMGSP
jgi:hypothetical protein